MICGIRYSPKSVNRADYGWWIGRRVIHSLAERGREAVRSQLELERRQPALDPELQLGEQSDEWQRGASLPQLLLRVRWGCGGKTPQPSAEHLAYRL